MTRAAGAASTRVQSARFLPSLSRARLSLRRGGDEKKRKRIQAEAREEAPMLTLTYFSRRSLERNKQRTEVRTGKARQQDGTSMMTQ